MFGFIENWNYVHTADVDIEPAMQEALNMLGYNTYHAIEFGLDAANGSVKNWHAAIDAKYFGKGKPWKGEDFERMLWRYDAVTDVPCALFVDELIEAYPDAKIVVTNRDVEPWIKSVKASYYEILSWKRWWWIRLVERDFLAHYIPVLQAAVWIWTKGHPENPERLRDGFSEHYAHIRKIVPKEKLLEYKVSEGWEPLCKFLEKPVPNQPFPRINEGSATADLHNMMFWYMFVLTVGKGLKIVVPIGIAGLAYSYWNR